MLLSLFFFFLNKLDVGVTVHAIEDGASTFLLSKASLIFSEERIYGKKCYRCQEPILDPTYGCIKCKEYKFYHHISCAKLLLGFHHPFHPMHPFILFDESMGYRDKENSKCELCKEYHCKNSTISSGNIVGSS